ncbi:MAG TPA: lipid II flippase MurJ [Acidobacteriaceae bacterium]|nr:lipid II flippase MurJ [Acidobacteriaceae bacterium]
MSSSPTNRSPEAGPVDAPLWRRALAVLRPGHRHSPFSATVLLMASVTASRLIGLVRVKYIAWLLGRSAAADAFNAAFQLPDMVSYFLVGGAASITFITILTRYRDEGREHEGERAMSAILTMMAVVLGGAVLVAEFAAPWFVRWWFAGFPAEKAALCTHLTRILLPAQLCFFAGGVFGAVLLVRRVFSVQAVAPLVYNAGIILGGVIGGIFLAREASVSWLAIGALAGAFCGPFLLNAIGAHRVGMRFRPLLDWNNPGLREWVRMSIPLMLGVSLVTADNWIINYFASHVGGAITLLTYAKTLFTAPVALGQAAGAASLPFLAALFGKQDRRPFAEAVNSSVSRILAFSFLLSAFMIAMALPLVDVLVRGGAFHRADSGVMALYFAIFSVSLCLWSAQALYARAFYAAGNTITPMVAGTIITAASIPVYWTLYRALGPMGLAMASDAGILLQTTALAVLLHRRRMVSLAGLEYGELGRALLAALVSFAALAALRHLVHTTSRLHELALLAAAAFLWITVAGLVLRFTGSSLTGQLLSRFSSRA